MIVSLLALAVNLALTPGVVRPLTTAQVCAMRWGVDHRHVTRAMQRTVAASYGVPWAKRHAYVFDHLVPRELGGADEVRNLWPEPVADARRKDRLERRLHQEVCAGRLALSEAQDRMRHYAAFY